MKDPLKQGLKRYKGEDKPFTDWNVEVKDPLKQGLKHISVIPAYGIFKR